MLLSIGLLFIIKWGLIIFASIYLGKKAYPYIMKAYSFLKSKFSKKA